MKILILAGGFATRLWPLTENRAKPLLLLDGQPILGHILAPLKKAGFTDEDLILLTNQKFKADFIQFLDQTGWGGATIFCEDAHSDGEKLGALGAITAATQKLSIEDDVMVLAGDNIITDFDPQALKPTSNQAVITVRQVTDLHEARKFGVVETNPKNQVIGFEEKPAQPKSTQVLAGFMSFSRDLLPIIDDFSQKEPDALGGIFSELLRQNVRVTTVSSQGHWFDIGSFETYLEAHKALNQNNPDPKQGNNTFQGQISIADNANVSDCVLINSLIYPGTTIKNCRLANCVIDSNCHLEGLDLSQKLIRQGTTLINH